MVSSEAFYGFVLFVKHFATVDFKKSSADKDDLLSLILFPHCANWSIELHE